MAGANKARILFVAAQSGFQGGAERYIYDAALALENHGFEADGLFIDRAGDNARYESVFSRVYGHARLRQLKSGEYDLVFIHKIHDSAIIRLLRANFKVAVMIHDHEYCCLRQDKSFSLFGGRCRRPFNLLFCAFCSGLVDRSHDSPRCFNFSRRQALVNEIKACDAYVVTSTFMRDELLYNGFDVARMVKIYPVCRVAPRRTRVRRNNETPVIVFAGQLVREKGVKQLLEALSMIRYDFKAYIIGAGPEEKRCRRLVGRLWLEQEIEFIGWRDDLGEYLEKADIAVFPAIGSEPFGQAGPEAMAYGLPVVGFDSGGVSEWLRHERNGLLVPRKNIREFADALEMLINDPGYACRLGDEGRTWVATYMSEASYVSGFKLMLDRIHSR